MIGKLSFNNPRRGKQPRANVFFRTGRRLRLKRVEYEHDQVAETIKHLKRQINQMYAIAKAHKVPLDAMAALPPMPDLPGEKWIEHLHDMGDLKAPVKPQAEAAPQDAYSIAAKIAWNGPKPT